MAYVRALFGVFLVTLYLLLGPCERFAPTEALPDLQPRLRSASTASVSLSNSVVSPVGNAT